MLHRIINWIKNPFKKKEEEVKFTLRDITPLTEEQKKQITADLIQAAKEFKEKKELDVLPVSRISKESKEKIVEIMKEDIKAQIEAHPATEEVTLTHEVKITETAAKKKKPYYRKKKASASTENKKPATAKNSNTKK